MRNSQGQKFTVGINKSSRAIFLAVTMSLATDSTAEPLSMRRLVASVEIGKIVGSRYDFGGIEVPRYCVRPAGLMRCEPCETERRVWVVVEDDVNGYAEIDDQCVNGLGIGFRTQYALFITQRQKRLFLVSAWTTGSQPVLRAYGVNGYALTPLNFSSVVPPIPWSLFMPDGFAEENFGQIRRIGFEPRIAYTLPRIGTEVLADLDFPYQSVPVSHMEPSERRLLHQMFNSRKYFVALQFDPMSGAFKISGRRLRDPNHRAAKGGDTRTYMSD